jgi:D-alanyl-lipoteichoic acid acyltransferase DltB (MBOAT superfamily)
LFLGAFYFAIQIYCDFSGYTDIAIGTAKLLGFELLSNFRYPYGATSISEFWKRWHISLSTWFYDYVFNPIVVSLRNWGTWAIAFGVIITFLISGLWHGAAWHYVAWGLWYGIALAYEALTRSSRKKLFKKMPSRVAGFISWSCTFLYICIGYILFRAKTLHIAFDYMWHMTHHFLSTPALKSFLFFYVLPFVILDWYFRKDERAIRLPGNLFIKYSFYTLMVFAILYHSNDNSGFIYFQF